MQAIEFNAIVRSHFIPLPEPLRLKPGLPVRVVVMYEEPTDSVVDAKKSDAISDLCADPLRVDHFTPLSRDAAHER
jgi:hypothetical protein